MALHWTAADLRTGNVIAEFPLLEIDWPLRRSIGAYDTTVAHLPWRSAPENWEQATQPGSNVLVCYDTNDPLQTPLWGGYITGRNRPGSEFDKADLSLATIDGYFDRRYVRNQAYAATGQNSIVESLLNLYVVDGARPGIPLTIVKLDGNGTPRDRQYFETDDATVYSRITELMGVNGGPEWMTEWQWASSMSKLVPVLTVGSRLGSAARTGIVPGGVFDMPGCVTSFQFLEDYSQGKGANAVIASGSGQGDVRPESAEAFAADFDGRPQFEFRWTPSTSISDVATLNSYATQAAVIMNGGSQPVSLRAMRSVAPVYGLDWFMGDDIAYNIEHPLIPEGLNGIARAVAYELYQDEIAPILAVPAVTSDS